MKRLLLVLVMLIAMNASGQWAQMSNGMGNDKTIISFCTMGTNIFAGNYIGGGVYKTTNDGINWTLTGFTGQLVIDFAIIGTNIFAGTYGGGVFLSTNNGANWTAVNNGLLELDIYSLASMGTRLFAGTDQGGVFLSTNNGASWTVVNNGFPQYESGRRLVVMGTNIFAATNYSGVFKSTNYGTSWTAVNNGLTNLHVKSFTVSGTNLFAGTYLGGIFLSTNYGLSWTTSNNELSNSIVVSLAVSGNNLFAGVVNMGVYLSTNNGTSWINKNQGFNNIKTVAPLIISNNYIFAGRDSQSVFRRSLSEIIGIQNISTETPSSYSLGQNYPNPFNSSSKFKFQNSKLGNVKIVVYDIMGKEVQTLVNERLQPGTYEASFDGSMLNSGVYFYKLTTIGFTETKKMALIK